MTETTTLPAREGAALAIAIEDDATPFVRQIAQALRRAARTGHAAEVLGGAAGAVAVRSHDTPQAATITLGEGTVEVASGVRVVRDATVVVDVHARFASVQEAEGDGVLAAAALSALQPPLPHWREAAVSFWNETRGIAGIPDVLVVDAVGPDGVEHGRFGVGATEYLLAGPADLLAGIFTGADDFLAALAAGVQVKGTLSQLSVLTAASWKVRFDV